MQSLKAIVSLYKQELGIWEPINEPSHENTNNMVSEQVQHKPVCAVTEAG